MSVLRQAGKTGATIGLAVGLVGALAAPALAKPAELRFEFTDCNGPAGTPGSFAAVKQPGSGAALHLVDGSGVFIAVSATDVATGTVLFSTPGYDHNAIETVTCRLVHPVTGDRESIVGKLSRNH